MSIWPQTNYLKRFNYYSTMCYSRLPSYAKRPEGAPMQTMKTIIKFTALVVQLVRLLLDLFKLLK
jgi:hypothetical protein